MEGKIVLTDPDHPEARLTRSPVSQRLLMPHADVVTAVGLSACSMSVRANAVTPLTASVWPQ
jgi:hypothetical protein